MERATVITEQSHLLRGASAAEQVGTVVGGTVEFADGRTFVADADLVDVLNLLLGSGLASRRAHVVVDTEWVSPEVAASILGVSRPTVYKWLDAGVLDSIYVGTHRRVPREDVEAVVRARTARARTDDVLTDVTLEAPLSDEQYREAALEARRSGGAAAAAALRQAQRAAKARAAAKRAQRPVE